MRILVTGGCGFIGHHFVDHIIRNTDWEVIILDRLSYASNGFDRLRDSKLFDQSRIHVLTADFTKPIVDGLADEIGAVDYIVHMGAETHVDRSIDDPRPFIFSNVVGTMELLQFARTLTSLKKFIYFSTDEVFGPSYKGYAFREWDRYKSSTPYAASKAGGEELCLAYHNTYNVPIVIMHTMNVIGERQHPEKFVPMTIKNIINNNEIKLHRDLATGEYSSRNWIHARNVADAVLFLIDKGTIGEKYNVVGEKWTNAEITALIAGSLMGVKFKYVDVDANMARAGHDLHYAMDGSRMRELGWKAPIDFMSSLQHTVIWFRDNPRWLKGG